MKIFGFYGLTLLFVLLLILTVNAQNPVMKVISDTSCQSYIETPILVRDFDSVAAISMKIVFDTTRLTYLGYRNAHPAVAQNGNFIASTYQDRFIIGWFSLNPISITSDTLLVIRWQGTSGPPVRLWFDTTRGMCELVDFYGVRFNTQFVDGVASPSIRVAPSLVSPPDTSAFSSNDVLFVYEESPCRTGPSVIQVSRDSLFASNPSESLFLASSTFYQWFSIPFCGSPLVGFPSPENGPCWHASSGDSLVFWRVGAVYGMDTLWSDFRRISLSLTAGLRSDVFVRKSFIYPNPVRNYLCIQASDSVLFRWETARLFSSNGSLLKEFLFSNEDAVQPNNFCEFVSCYINKNINSGFYFMLISDMNGVVHCLPFYKI